MVLLSFLVVVILLSFEDIMWMYPYLSGLHHWHWGNRTIAPMPVTQPGKIWIKSTITKQHRKSTHKICGIYCVYNEWDVLCLSQLNLLYSGPQDSAVVQFILKENKAWNIFYLCSFTLLLVCYLYCVVSSQEVWNGVLPLGRFLWFSFNLLRSEGRLVLR